MPERDKHASLLQKFVKSFKTVRPASELSIINTIPIYLITNTNPQLPDGDIATLSIMALLLCYSRYAECRGAFQTASEELVK
jgi:hypothetical protein